MLLLSLLTTAFSTVFYGFIATAVMMAFLYLLLRVINVGTVKGLVFYATGVVLAVLLLIQFSLLIGAVEAIDTVNAAGLMISQMVEQAEETLQMNDTRHLFDAVTDKFPLIGLYIGACDVPGNTVETVAATMVETMCDCLTAYIWRRVLWIVGLSFVACVVVVIFRQKENNYIVDYDILA